MKVLLVHNFHRQGGGSDDAVLASAEVLREGGNDVRLFQRDSRDHRRLRVAEGECVRDRDLRAPVGEGVSPRARVLRTRRDPRPRALPADISLGAPGLSRCRRSRRHDLPRLPAHVPDRHALLARSDLHRLHQAQRAQAASRTTAEAITSRAPRTRPAQPQRGCSGLVRNIVCSVRDPHTIRGRVAGEARRLSTWTGPRSCRTSSQSPTSPARSTAGSYVAYAGRFVPEKGVDVLLAAARATGLPLHLAGNPGALSG